MDTNTKWYKDSSIYPCIIQDSRDGELAIVYRYERNCLLGFGEEGRIISGGNIPHWRFVSSLKSLIPEYFI